MNWFSDSTLMGLIDSIGWTIIHSLWQGLIVAIIFAIILVVLKKQSSKIKYNFSLALLALFFISNIAVLVYNYSPNDKINQRENTAITNIENRHLQKKDLVAEPILFQQTAETENITQPVSYSLVVLKSYIKTIIPYLVLAWLIGFVISLILAIASFFSNQRLRINPLNQPSQKWQSKIYDISKRLKIRRKIKILFSPLVVSPIVFGIIKPIILFPVKAVTKLNNKEIEAILVHELAHVLRNDYLFNIFQVIVETLFFYHPTVWWISSKIREQRELICDEIAIDVTNETKLYAATLVKLEEQRVLQPAFALGGNTNNNKLFKRIKWIMEDKKQRTNTNYIKFILGLSIISVFSVFIFSSAKSRIPVKISKHTVQKMSTEILEKDFQGSFILYDTKNLKYTVINDSISKVRYSPYSTFKTISALVGLETGIASDENYTLTFDKKKHKPKPSMLKSKPFMSWWQDHSLKSAMKNSVNWYFFELNEQIGFREFETHVKMMGYGNSDVSSGLDNFWIGGSLNVSAQEQVEFLKQLVENDLNGFSVESQEKLKGILLNESTPKYKIYGKTGSGEYKDKVLGWYIGFVETEDNTYCFAFNIIDKNYKKVWAKRIKITKAYLRELGVI